MSYDDHHDGQTRTYGDSVRTYDSRVHTRDDRAHTHEDRAPTHDDPPQTLDDQVQVALSGARGQGVFARRRFEIGERVLSFSGTCVEAGDVDNLDHYLQVGPTTFLGPSGRADDYVNHACDPNSGIEQEGDQIFLRALRPIEAAEELTWDYSTTMVGGFWSMDCACQSPQCRGWVGDFHELPPDVRRRYMDMGVVADFVLEANPETDN